MKFAPESLRKWRERKIAVDRAVSRGEMSAEEGHDVMKLFVSRLMATEAAGPPERHLRAVK